MRDAAVTTSHDERKLGAVGLTDDDMDMDHLRTIFQGDVPHQGEYFDLFIEWDLMVALRLPVEETQHNICTPIAPSQHSRFVCRMPIADNCKPNHAQWR
jgi:hypothetical protein